VESGVDFADDMAQTLQALRLRDQPEERDSCDHVAGCVFVDSVSRQPFGVTSLGAWTVAEPYSSMVGSMSEGTGLTCSQTRSEPAWRALKGASLLMALFKDEKIANLRLTNVLLG
jgi:hypothetical protein